MRFSLRVLCMASPVLIALRMSLLDSLFKSEQNIRELTVHIPRRLRIIRVGMRAVKKRHNSVRSPNMIINHLCLISNRVMKILLSFRCGSLHSISSLDVFLL